MAISMTGFGRGEVKSDNYQFLVECKTINHRYCDINMIHLFCKYVNTLKASA